MSQTQLKLKLVSQLNRQSIKNSTCAAQGHVKNTIKNYQLEK